jgi:hypothetical protein
MNQLTSLLIAALVGLSLGASGTYKIVANHYRAEAAAQKEADAKAYQARAVELNDVSAELERVKSEKKVIYRTVTKRVETYIDRPIYLRDAYDDDGVRDVNATFADAADPGQPGARVPGTDATGRKDRRNRPAEND